MLHPDTPVIIGVGQMINRLDDDDYKPLSNVELAASAVRLALEDTGAREQLTALIDVLATTRTFEDSAPRYQTPFGKSNNYPRSVAKRLGMSPREAIWSQAGGETPQKLVSEMCERIMAGEFSAAVVVGAEAISTAKQLMADQAEIDWSEELDEQVDDRGRGLRGLSMRYAIQHKILGGPDAYAVLENARRASKGLDRETYRAQMADLFAPFSQVAATHPCTSTKMAYSAEEIGAITERNRMIADPYPRLMVARDQVNMSAAVIITSIRVADELGIPESNRVFLHGYAAASERPIQERAELGVAKSAPLSCQAALDSAGIGIDDVRYIDLYSCFPIAVSNVCDGLGVSETDPRGLTLTGGLPYFGGPGNSYSMHAIVSLVDKLRADPGSFGLIGANGGQLSKYAAGVYSTAAKAFAVCSSESVQEQVNDQPKVDLAFEADGEAVIESYTVVYGRSGPAYGVVVGRLKDSDARFYANTEEGDDETLLELVDADPLGRTVFVRSFGKGNRFAFTAEKLVELYPPKAPELRDDYEFIQVERRGRVLEITMNRPEVRNALHPPAHEELDEIFDAFFADPELWVAILTGAGGESFTAGNDLKYSAKNPVYLPKNGFAALTRRGNMTKPVIAAVNGYAMGGGLEICMACDLVVADARSTFGLTEVKVGLVPGEGGLVRLPRRVPRMLANEMILTGKRLTSSQAMDFGLINRIAPDGEALQAARELADEILEASPTSVRVCMQIMRDTESMPDELEACRWKHPGIDDLMSSDDAVEGPVAFAQKRKPVWKNH